VAASLDRGVDAEFNAESLPYRPAHASDGFSWIVGEGATVDKIMASYRPLSAGTRLNVGRSWACHALSGNEHGVLCLQPPQQECASVMHGAA